MANTLFQSSNNSVFNQPSTGWNIPQIQTTKKDVQGSYRAAFKSISIHVTNDDKFDSYSTTILSQPQYQKLVMYIYIIVVVDGTVGGLLSNSVKINRRLTQIANVLEIQLRELIKVNIHIQQDLKFPQFSQSQLPWENNNIGQQTKITDYSRNMFKENDSKQHYFSSANNQNNQHQFANTFNGQNTNIFANTSNNTNNDKQHIFQTNNTNIFSAQSPFNNQNKQEFNKQPQKDINSLENNSWQQQQQVTNIFQQKQLTPSISIPSQQILASDQLILNQHLQQPQVQSNQVQQQPSQQYLTNFQYHQPQQPLQLQLQSLATPNNQMNYLAQPLLPLNENPIEIVRQHLQYINNFTNTLNHSITEMERLKNLEQEKYYEQENWINQIEQKKRIERQQKQQSFNIRQQKKYEKSLRSLSPFNSQIIKTDSRISDISSSMRVSKIQTKGQNASIKINQAYLIELYFEESENFVTLNEDFELEISRAEIKKRILQRLDTMNVFKNNKQYLEKSELIQNENLNSDEKPLLSINILSTYRPILTKKGYFTMPDINSLTIQELKHVEDLIIFNEYGSIRWDSPTNLMYLNFDCLVEIQDQKVEVYDSEKIHEYMKPRLNKKLNKPCLITLRLPDGLGNQQNTFLEQKCQEQGADLVSINNEKKQFTVRVQHFSKYEFTHDINESENTPVETQQSQQSMFFNSFEQFKEQYHRQDLSVKQANQKISIFNDRTRKNIPLLIEISLANKEMIVADYSFYEKYVSFELNDENQTDVSIKFVKCLLQLKQNILEKKKHPQEISLITKRLQWFNILFGNSSISLDDSITLIELHSDKYNVEDFKLIQGSKEIGLSLMMYLEDIIITRDLKVNNCNYSEYVIQQIKNDSSLNKQKKYQQIFPFLSVNPSVKVKLPFQSDDWISCIMDWKVSGQCRFSQFSQEWWNGLLNILKQFEIQSSELAALIFFISKKLHKPYKRIYDFLNKYHDEMSFFLELIIFQSDKDNSLTHKRIMINKITFLIENNEDPALIMLIVRQFTGKLFNEKESKRLTFQIQRMQNTLNYSNNYKQLDIESHLLKLIDQQNYIEAGQLLLNSDIKNSSDYWKFLFEYTIPILIIFGEKQLLQEIIQQINCKKWRLSQRQNTAKQMGEVFIHFNFKVYCNEKQYDCEIFEGFKAGNVFEYQMVQLLDEYYFM